MTTSEDYQLPPKEGFVLTHFLTVADVQRSAEFYLRILGGTIVRSGEPTIIHIANSWLILNDLNHHMSFAHLEYCAFTIVSFGIRITTKEKYHDHGRHNESWIPHQR